MSPVALRLVHDVTRQPKAKAQVKPQVAGRWFAVTADFTITDVDSLQPEDMPAACLFMRSGTMSAIQSGCPTSPVLRTLVSICHSCQRTGAHAGNTVSLSALRPLEWTT